MAKIQDYRKNANLYRENYYAIDQVNTINQYISKADYDFFPIHSLISNFYADLLTYHDLKFEIENSTLATAIDAWNKKEQINLKLYDIIVETSSTGNSFVEISINEQNPAPDLILLEGDKVEVVFDNYSRKKTVIKYIIKENYKIKSKDYIMTITHDKNSIRYAFYRNQVEDQNKVNILQFDDILDVINFDEIDEVNNEVVYNHNLNSFLVFHFKNTAIPNLHEELGLSDYTNGINTKSRKYNLFLNEIQGILYRHSNPKLKLGTSIINKIKNLYNEKRKTHEAKDTRYTLDDLLVDQDLATIATENRVSQAELDFLIKQTKIIEVDDIDSTAEYLTWDAKLDYQFKNIDSLLNSMFIIAGISRLALENSQDIATLSGKALEKLFSRSLQKVSRKKANIEAVLINIYYLIAKILNIQSEIKVTIDLDVYKDQHAIKDLYSDLLNMGLSSKIKAIKAIYGVNDEQANLILENIRNEAKEEINNFMQEK